MDIDLTYGRQGYQFIGEKGMSFLAHAVPSDIQNPCQAARGIRTRTR